MKPSVPNSATIPETLDLLAFCRVVDLGSVTEAAKALGETKGTISRRVARLEEKLGTALLRRSGRRIEATEDGQSYREIAGHALALLDEGACALRSAVPSGILRVTAPLGIASTMFGEMLPAFLDAYPEVSVEMLLTDTVLSFREANLDVALRISSGLPDSSLVAHRLLDLAPILVASPDYLRRKGVPQTPADLENHDMLVVPVHAGRQRFSFDAPNDGGIVNISVKGRLLAHDVLLLRELALAGSGITGVLPPLGQTEIAAGRLVRVLPDWTPRATSALYLLHAGGNLAPKVRAFRDHIKNALKVIGPCQK